MTTRLTTTGSTGAAIVQKSISNFEDQKRINMFKMPDVFPMFISTTRRLSGCILPAFDPSYAPEDAARASSIGSYRDLNSIDPKTKCPAFANWCLHIQGYSYYGVGMSSFVSPSMDGMIDPIHEIRNYVLSQGESSKYAYLLKPANYRENWLPRPEHLVLLNVWSGTNNENAKDQSIRNRILVLKRGQWRQLQEDLNELHPAAAGDARDKNWPAFKLGDITGPVYTLKFHTGTYELESKQSAAKLVFAETSFSPGTNRLLINCVPVRLREEMLRGRYDLPDIVNVLHIPTTQEVVELLVHEGKIPYDLIVEAVGRYVDKIPEKPVLSVVKATEQVHPTTWSQPGLPHALPRGTQQATQEENMPMAVSDAQNEDVIPGLEPVVKSKSEQVPVASSGLTPEEQEECEQLQKELWENPATFTKTERLLALRAKKEGVRIQ